MSLLHDYHFHDYSFVDFPPAGRILDVGCGGGQQMEELVRRGYETIGVDPDPRSVSDGRNRGLDMREAFAEHLPIPDASVDGVVCKVVIPYTKSAEAVREIARVLKTGGIGRLCYHGSGYYLLYLFRQRTWRMRLYGLRSLVNTWCYAVTGRRLPGFWGDTIYQSRTRLSRYYRRFGLKLIEDPPTQSFCGFPVFIYHTVEKVGQSHAAAASERVAAPISSGG